MSGYDPEWCLIELRAYCEFVRQRDDETAAALATGALFETAYRKKQADLQEQIVGQRAVVERVLDRVTPRWRETSKGAFHDIDSFTVGFARRAIAVIEREAEIAEHLGDGAPALDVGKLHPWAWENGASFWRTGHFRQAVVEASKRINAETQAKVNRRDVSEAKLFQEVFSTSGPQRGRPRLRLCKNDGGDTFKNRHLGAKSLAEGLYWGVRNPDSHELQTAELEEHIALERLAAFSVLARWIHDAVVEFAEVPLDEDAEHESPR